MSKKAFWKSKTLYVNLIAVAAILVQSFTGNDFLIDLEIQAQILAGINIILRLITKDGVSWK